MTQVDAPRDIGELFDRVGTPSEGVISSLRAVEGDVLVLGAGGKMGLHLCLMLRRAFSELGMMNRVIAVSRFGDGDTRRLFESFDLDIRPCDLTSPGELAALPDSENVFFLAGVKFGTANDAGLLQKMNVEVPARVSERFRDAAIVALSTGCVYPYVTPGSGGAVEETEVAPVGAYAVSCLGRERAFAAASVEYGTRIALIRLNYSIDLRYGVLVDIAQKVLAGEPVDVTMGYVNVIWQGDALSHIVQALAHCAAPPFILNVTGPAILSVREIAEEFGRIFERRVKLTGEEEETAWLSNATKACRLFGKPAVSESALIGMVADWLRGGGQTLGKPTHFETRDGKY